MAGCTAACPAAGVFAAGDVHAELGEVHRGRRGRGFTDNPDGPRVPARSVAAPGGAPGGMQGGPRQEASLQCILRPQTCESDDRTDLMLRCSVWNEQGWV